MSETHQDAPRLKSLPDEEALPHLEPGMMAGPLADGRVELWHVGPDDVGEEGLERCRRLLSPDETAQADRFVFEKDRRLFIVARTMLRVVLSRYLERDPGTLVFHHNHYGKPYLAGPSPWPIHFNVSHTAGLAVCAVTRDREIGVDVEETGRPVEELELAGKFFAPVEATALAELPGPARREAFFRYWTLKEAYIKARGMGLSMPLQCFAFRLGSGRAPAIWFADPGGDRPEDWQFAEFPLRGRYQVAVAVRHPRSKALEIVVQEMGFGSGSGVEPCG